MRQIKDIQELRSIQMGILDNIHQFCEEHGITYFLSSGSLIGAVRHGGYIPWDDDLDIYMPRKSYEQFIEKYTDETGVFRVINPKKEPHYYYTFAKVVDERTYMQEDETEGYAIGVYVDVFPCDYVPDDMKQRERVFRWKYLLYKIRRAKISHTNPFRSALAYWCYRLLPVTVKQLNRWIQRLIVRKEPTNWVCNMSESGPKMKGCFPAEAIASMVDIKFEDRTYKTFVGYKDYLSYTYGDYMTLPPEDQRETHHFKAYWKD
jgi:lipopolysaccharide cholinephosphotransferase